MNAFSFCFIGPLEVGIIFVTIVIPAFLLGLVVIAVVKYINRSSDKSKKSSNELENQFNKFQNESFTQEDVHDYYPVKERNKISLIPFNEIVDFSAGNNYVFLTDSNGKDYLVESNLSELETKLPKDFIRVHKSTIANRKRIGEIKKLANGRYELVMKCDKSRIISCSKSYNENIRSIIDF